MTITVTVLIEGNKQVEAIVLDATVPVNPGPLYIHPGEFQKILISGDQVLTITEHGEFI